MNNIRVVVTFWDLNSISYLTSFAGKCEHPCLWERLKNTTVKLLVISFFDGREIEWLRKQLMQVVKKICYPWIKLSFEKRTHDDWLADEGISIARKTRQTHKPISTCFCASSRAQPAMFPPRYRSQLPSSRFHHQCSFFFLCFVCISLYRHPSMRSRSPKRRPVTRLWTSYSSTRLLANERQASCPSITSFQTCETSFSFFFNFRLIKILS